MTVEYELCAAEAELPAESLNVTLWYSVGSMAAAHGLEKWSEAHWNMIREYGKLMRRMHQNVFWITWTPWRHPCARTAAIHSTLQIASG